MRVLQRRAVIATLGLFVIGVIAALAAAPVGATVFTATFTGTFAGAGDFAGLFGSTIDLAGTPFSATYRIDTGVPGINAFTSLNSHFFYSGSRYGGLPTAITATLSSNGQSVALRGTTDGFIWQENDLTPAGRTGNGDYLNYVLDGYNNGPTYDYNASLSFQIAGVTDILPTDNYATPGHYHFGPGTLMDNRFAVYNGNQPLAYGSLIATDLVVRAGVPEPAAWALMFGGLGLTGAMLRRRTSLRMVAA